MSTRDLQFRSGKRRDEETSRVAASASNEVLHTTRTMNHRWELMN
jgi:hypothetical protein